MQERWNSLPVAEAYDIRPGFRTRDFRPGSRMSGWSYVRVIQVVFPSDQIRWPTTTRASVATAAL